MLYVNVSAQSLRQTAVRWAVFAVLFAATIVPAYLPVDHLITSISSVWAIIALAPGGFKVGEYPETTIYLEGSGWIVGLVYWSLVGVVYALLTRRLRIFHVISFTYPAVLLAFYAAMLGLFALGMDINAPL